MKITTIILKFEKNNNLEECLDSLRRSNLKEIENNVIVIDNSKDNRGFSGGNNIGIREALKNKVDAVLLLNDDTKLKSDMVFQLVKVITSDEGIGAVVPKIYFYPGFEYHKDRYKPDNLGKVIWYAGGGIDWNNIMGIHFGVDEVDSGQYDRRKEVGFATGCAVMIKREVLEKVGFFDERYFLYLEDMDLSMRIKRAGYKLIYEPKAIVWHKNAGSSEVGSSLHDYFFVRNRLLFGMKYATFRTKFALAREGGRMLFGKNKWKRQGMIDFCLRKFGKGSWK